ncbi:hypothetical protein ACH4RC_38920, partial [Streptomyces sp. NPDC016845]
MIPPQHHGALPGRRTVLRGALLTATAALSATRLAGRSPSSPSSGTPTASQPDATTGSTVKLGRVLGSADGHPFGEVARDLVDACLDGDVVLA